jgi:zinc transporter 1/2/3
MTSGTASVVSGILDSISAGILLYSATVELMVSQLVKMPRTRPYADNLHLQAHEFIFTPHYHTCSWKRVNLVLFYFALGAGLMAVLGQCSCCVNGVVLTGSEQVNGYRTLTDIP